jgi:predicted GNAT superfamily acetyltransferase
VSAPSWAAESVEIRPLRTPAEYRACVALQKETWGAEFSESVPASILNVCQRIGGVASGAFDPDGRLLGFVFGLTGVEGSRRVHWSDMLAVRREARGSGIGRRLKEHQRDVLRALEVETVYWSFEPLEARNAHLNLERLGVEVVEYVVDMYGASDSDLHRGLGTDRLVVAWRIAPPHRSTGERPAASPRAPEPEPLRIPIPLDIQSVKRSDPDTAARWRAETRRAFQGAFRRGYRVSGFRRDAGPGLGCYVLLPGPGPAG